MLFIFFVYDLICMLPGEKEELGGILYSNVHRSDPEERVVAVKIIVYKWMKTESPALQT